MGDKSLSAHEALAELYDMLDDAEYRFDCLLAQCQRRGPPWFSADAP